MKILQIMSLAVVFSAFFSFPAVAAVDGTVETPMFTLDAATLADQVPAKMDGELQPRCENNRKKPAGAKPCSPANGGYSGHDQSRLNIFSPLSPDDAKKWAKLIDKSPDRSSALLERAIAYKNAREFGLALADVNTILKTWHSCDDALRIRAMLYYFGGQYELSLKDLDAADYWSEKAEEAGVQHFGYARELAHAAFRLRNYVALNNADAAAKAYDRLLHTYKEAYFLDNNSGFTELMETSRFVYVKESLKLNDFETRVVIHNLGAAFWTPWKWENCEFPGEIKRAYDANILKFEVLQFYLTAPQSCLSSGRREDLLDELQADAMQRLNADLENRAAVWQLSELNHYLATDRQIAGNVLGALSAYNMSMSFFDDSIKAEAAQLKIRTNARDRYANEHPAEARQLNVVSRENFTIKLEELKAAFKGVSDDLDILDLKVQGCLNDRANDVIGVTTATCNAHLTTLRDAIHREAAAYADLADRTDGTPAQRQEARGLFLSFKIRLESATARYTSD